MIFIGEVATFIVHIVNTLVGYVALTIGVTRV